MRKLFSKILTVSITSKPCLAQDGHDIILHLCSLNLTILISHFQFLPPSIGSSDKDILIVSPIPSKSRDPKPIEDLILPGKKTCFSNSKV